MDKSKKKSIDNELDIKAYEDKIPKEVLEESCQTIREDIVQDLLTKIKESTLEFLKSW